jgi:hypothetical protein
MANEFKIKKGLIVQGSGSTILDIQGSQGQLFSVTDSLSGSLFSVNDISGIPILEVFSDNSVNLGTFGNEAIKVLGNNASITGSLFGTASFALTASFVPNTFIQNGNSFGTTATLGTNDNQSLQFETNGTTKMFISSSGNVGIGITSPGYPLEVSGSVGGTSIYASNDIVAFSDQSVKENIRPIENVLERIGNSRGVLYDRVDSGDKNNIGFIAQELEIAFPELVVTNSDGTKAVKYQNTVAVLFEAIKEQQKQINDILTLLNK